jgi:tripartite-type tricarboxylate transporter receptor subunit TctC
MPEHRRSGSVHAGAGIGHGWLARLLILLAAALSAGGVRAAYPERPVRFVVPYSPGGPSDTLARLVGKGLTGLLGQSFVIDVRPGASTIVGTEIVARAPADGYTIVTVSTTHTVNPALFAKLPYDPVRAFAPVTMMAATPFVLCVHPAVAATTVAELVALAKTRPGALAYASGGSGSSLHLTAEYFNGRAGVKMLHVPYKGAGPAFIDLVAGQVQLLFSSSVSSIPYVKSGRVRALAVTSLKRSAAVPNLPTVAESGYPGFESSSWFGVLAPAGTPAAIVTRLQEGTAAVLRSPDVAETLAGLGAEPGGMPSAEFGRYFRDEMHKWGNVVRAAGIRPD